MVRLITGHLLVDQLLDRSRRWISGRKGRRRAFSGVEETLGQCELARLTHSCAGHHLPAQHTQTPRDSKHEQRTTKKRAKDHREKVTIRHGIKRAAQQRWWQWWWWRWWTCLGLSKFFWERGPRTSAGAARVYETAGEPSEYVGCQARFNHPEPALVGHFAFEHRRI